MPTPSDPTPKPEDLTGPHRPYLTPGTYVVSIQGVSDRVPPKSGRRYLVVDGDVLHTTERFDGSNDPGPFRWVCRFDGADNFVGAYGDASWRGDKTLVVRVSAVRHPGRYTFIHADWWVQ